MKILGGLPVNITYKQNMTTIKFRFKDGVINISCPKISDKEIEKYIIENYNEFQIKLKESHLSDKFTYIQGQKYDIISIDEKYKSIIIDDKVIRVTKGLEEKLIIDFFIKDIQNYIKSKEEEMKYRFPNITYPTFKIRKLKSSFGQYNKKNHTITLDYRLAKYERIFLYLTLTHEFCHIIHFDHSKEFYDLLDTFVPNSKQMHKLMKKIKMNDIF